METRYVAPPRYSIKRVPGWLKRQNAAQFSRADLVLGMTSVWPQVDIYPLQRMSNIAVIPVAAAYSLIPGGQRVAINNRLEGPGYFWLNPANALMMLGIMHRDLTTYALQLCKQPDQGSQLINQLKTNYQLDSQQLKLKNGSTHPLANWV